MKDYEVIKGVINAIQDGLNRANAIVEKAEREEAMRLSVIRFKLFVDSYNKEVRHED
jgi:hypothetical protein